MKQSHVILKYVLANILLFTLIGVVFYRLDLYLAIIFVSLIPTSLKGFVLFILIVGGFNYLIYRFTRESID